jgi:hypothetical protein
MSRFGFRTRTGEIFNILNTSQFDIDAFSFFNRVYSAGGSLSITEQNAINKLILDLKNYNLWNLMKAIYPMVGNSAASCSQNLISSSFTGSFTSGWTFSNNGVNGNGSSTYFNTNLNQSSNLSASNNHISFYSRTDLNPATLNLDCGVTNNTSYSFNQISSRTSGNSVYENGSQVITIANSNSLGLYIGSSISSTSAKLYKNGSSIGSSTTTQARTLFNNNIYIGATCLSTTNAGLYFTTRQYAFVSIGDGLNDTQAANLYTAVQTFQFLLGRQV